MRRQPSWSTIPTTCLFIRNRTAKKEPSSWISTQLRNAQCNRRRMTKRMAWMPGRGERRCQFRAHVYNDLELHLSQSFSLWIENKTRCDIEVERKLSKGFGPDQWSSRIFHLWLGGGLPHLVTCIFHAIPRPLRRWEGGTDQWINNGLGRCWASHMLPKLSSLVTSHSNGKGAELGTMRPLSRSMWDTSNFAMWRHCLQSTLSLHNPWEDLPHLQKGKLLVREFIEI